MFSSHDDICATIVYFDTSKKKEKDALKLFTAVTFKIPRTRSKVPIGSYRYLYLLTIILTIMSNTYRFEFIIRHITQNHTPICFVQSDTTKIDYGTSEIIIIREEKRFIRRYIPRPEFFTWESGVSDFLLIGLVLYLIENVGSEGYHIKWLYQTLGKTSVKEIAILWWKMNMEEINFFEFEVSVFVDVFYK